MTILDHFERHLGLLTGGWKATNLQSDESEIRVIRFPRTPYLGATTFATVGLSDHVVTLSGGRTVRQELLFATRDEHPTVQVASFLLTFASFIKSNSLVLLRGDVVGPSAPLIPGVAANAVYASVPVIFPPGIETYRGTSPATVVVWLIPLMKSEAEFIRGSGWSRFEDLMEEKDPDLLDMNRSPVC
jgi:hypothetical protein